MENFWVSLIIEIGLFTLLGILYYFYQKRKLTQYEANKTSIVMGYILQACLTERDDSPDQELDAVIISIDDYLHNQVASPPLSLLKHFAKTKGCSKELKDVIEAGLQEIEKA